MENFSFYIASLIALGLLLFLAFPQWLRIESKRKKVGSTYWGAYQGAPIDDSEKEKTIELKPNARKLTMIAGSFMYSAGRGTSLRK